MSEKMTVVIGIGNTDRGDDGAGILSARYLQKRAPAGVQVRESGGDAADLLQMWEGAGCVVVIDAMVTGEAPGTIRVIEAADIDSTSAIVSSQSTHGFGLAEAVLLGRALGALPPRLVIVTVEGENFGVGEGLSRTVADAFENLTTAVDRVLQSFSNHKQEQLHA